MHSFKNKIRETLLFKSPEITIFLNYNMRLLTMADSYVSNADDSALWFDCSSESQGEHIMKPAHDVKLLIHGMTFGLSSSGSELS